MAAEAPATTTTSSIPRPPRVERPHVGGVLILLAILDLIVIGLAAYAVDKNFDDGGPAGANQVTNTLAIVSLIAGVLTLAAIISGGFHYKHFNSASVSSSTTTALIAWAVTLLAFGLACKQIDVGHVGSKMRALEAFVIILAFFETVYVFLLHGGLLNSKYGVGY